MLTYFFNKNNYRLSNGLQLPQSTVENIDKCFLNNTIYATFFFSYHYNSRKKLMSICVNQFNN